MFPNPVLPRLERNIPQPLTLRTQHKLIMRAQALQKFSHVPLPHQKRLSTSAHFFVHLLFTLEGWKSGHKRPNFFFWFFTPTGPDWTLWVGNPLCVSQLWPHTIIYTILYVASGNPGILYKEPSPSLYHSVIYTQSYTVCPTPPIHIYIGTIYRIIHRDPRPIH